MTNIKYILKYSIFVIVFHVFSSCKDKAISFNGQVYQMGTKKYGYSIFFKQKLVIKQESIPAVESSINFNDSIDALKVMDLVLEKLNKGQSPTVEHAELEALKIKM
jgi:hypothetical protein